MKKNNNPEELTEEKIREVVEEMFNKVDTSRRILVWVNERHPDFQLAFHEALKEEAKNFKTIIKE